MQYNLDQIQILGSRFLQNMSAYLPNYAVLHPRRKYLHIHLNENLKSHATLFKWTNLKKHKKSLSITVIEQKHLSSMNFATSVPQILLQIKSRIQEVNHVVKVK
jgi:hypothetical protein